MMDFMDNLRRGVDRAGFEVERLLRANRVRAQIAAIRSQMDEELRQMGRQAMESYDRGEQLPPALKEQCEQVKRYEAEIAQRELEFEGIDREIPPDVEAIPSGSPLVPKCPTCGHVVNQGANFCSNCGADVSGPASKPETVAEASPPSPPAPAG